MNKGSKSRYRLFLLAILCTMLWGSAIPTIKIGYACFGIAATATADQVLFAGVRFFGAGLLILIPYFLRHKRIRLTQKLCANSLTLGLIQTAGQYFFMYIGLAHTTGVNTSAFNVVGTLLYIVLAWLIYRDEKLSRFKLLGLAVGFSGILLNAFATQEMGMLSFKGDGLILLSNVCVAIGFLYSKHSVKNSDPFLLTGIQMSIGGLVLLVIGVALGGAFPTVTVSGVLLLLYLMLVSSVAFSLWTLLLRDYSAALVGMFNFLTPVFGTIFSYLLSVFGFLNETSAFTAYTILAVICAAGGILLSSLKTKKDEA